MCNWCGERKPAAKVQTDDGTLVMKKNKRKSNSLFVVVIGMFCFLSTFLITLTFFFKPPSITLIQLLCQPCLDDLQNDKKPPAKKPAAGALADRMAKFRFVRPL